MAVLSRGRRGRPTEGSAPGRWPALLLLIGVLLAHFRHGDGQVREPHARHTQCGIPIEAYVGAVDPGFGFEPAEVERALSEAIALWEAHSERPLFVANEPRRRMPVDLVFDERQALSNEMRQRQQALEAEERGLREAQTRYFRLQRQLDREVEALRRAVEEHEDAAAAAGPGARDLRPGMDGGPEPLRPRMRSASAPLDAERRRLEQEQRELNERIAALNEMAADIQRQVEDFNDRVASFNEVAAASSVTAAGYSFDSREGRRITIYRANDHAELVLVIAHELGHALGLDHVAQRDAVMHADVSSITLPVRNLTEADSEALRAACGG